MFEFSSGKKSNIHIVTDLNSISAQELKELVTKNSKSESLIILGNLNIFNTPDINALKLFPEINIYIVLGL